MLFILPPFLILLGALGNYFYFQNKGLSADEATWKNILKLLIGVTILGSAIIWIVLIVFILLFIGALVISKNI